MSNISLQDAVDRQADATKTLAGKVKLNKEAIAVEAGAKAAADAAALKAQGALDDLGFKQQDVGIALANVSGGEIQLRSDNRFTSKGVGGARQLATLPEHLIDFGQVSEITDAIKEALDGLLALQNIFEFDPYLDPTTDTALLRRFDIPYTSIGLKANATQAEIDAFGTNLVNLRIDAFLEGTANAVQVELEADGIEIKSTAGIYKLVNVEVKSNSQAIEVQARAYIDNANGNLVVEVKPKDGQSFETTNNKVVEVKFDRPVAQIDLSGYLKKNFSNVEVASFIAKLKEVDVVFNDLPIYQDGQEFTFGVEQAGNIFANIALFDKVKTTRAKGEWRKMDLANEVFLKENKYRALIEGLYIYNYTHPDQAPIASFKGSPPLQTDGTEYDKTEIIVAVQPQGAGGFSIGITKTFNATTKTEVIRDSTINQFPSANNFIEVQEQETIYIYKAKRAITIADLENANVTTP